MLETAVRHTTIIKDNMTAYSTAVGPSSLFRNRWIRKANVFIDLLASNSVQMPSDVDLLRADIQRALASCTKLISNVSKSRACVLADAGNSCQANNDNERQHNRVFNCGWSVFALQKTLQLHGEILHGVTLRQVSRLSPSVNNGTYCRSLDLNSSP